MEDGGAVILSVNEMYMDKVTGLLLAFNSTYHTCCNCKHNFFLCNEGFLVTLQVHSLSVSPPNTIIVHLSCLFAVRTIFSDVATFRGCEVCEEDRAAWYPVLNLLKNMFNSWTLQRSNPQHVGPSIKMCFVLEFDLFRRFLSSFTLLVESR